MSKARDLAGLFNLGSRSGTTAQRPATADVGDIYYNGTTGKTEIYTTTGWKEMASGIPFGNTAGRPAAVSGQPYFNGETARLEMYTATGWQNIVQEVPGVASITGTYSEATNSGTITIAGTNFVSGAIASAIGSNGVEVIASSTTYNSLVQIVAVFTGLSNVNEPYDIKVTNPSNLFGLIPDALYINASPVWTTTAGTLGTFNEQVSVSLSATATDSDSTITYALASGSTLPTGVSLNASTGAITGTLPDITTDTTYSFIVNASDGLNTIPRTFSITSTAQIVAETLVVAGGGGGGSNGNTTGGGGGGAGGYLYSTSTAFLKGSSYSLSVGLGGTGRQQSTSSPSSGNKGGSSSISGSGFSSITAIGGGGGVSNQSGGILSDSSGGSGGGGNYVNPSGTGTSGQGNNGGNSWSYVSGANELAFAGGGGGGSGGTPSNGTNSAAGNGGDGTSNSITGTALFYAAGGGGGARGGYTSGTGGSGIGGGGSVGSSLGGNATVANRGSGGGGGGGNGNNPQYIGGSGSDGVIIIAYPDTKPALVVGSGLTYDQPTRSGYRVYRFTSGSGTVTF
jgi:hypothetical protein